MAIELNKQEIRVKLRILIKTFTISGQRDFYFNYSKNFRNSNVEEHIQTFEGLKKEYPESKDLPLLLDCYDTLVTNYLSIHNLPPLPENFKSYELFALWGEHLQKDGKDSKNHLTETVTGLLKHHPLFSVSGGDEATKKSATREEKALGRAIEILKGNKR